MSKILIVEDHKLVAEGLAMGLEAEGFEVRTSPGDLGVARRDLAEFAPEIVLLDLGLGEFGSGLDLLAEIVGQGCNVVVLTGETNPRTLGRAFDLGATAVLGKTIPFPSLVEELREVRQGGTKAAAQKRKLIEREIRRLEAERDEQLAVFRELSKREEEVLEMLIDGRQAAEIAELSYVSLSTIRSQIRGILLKLGVGSQLAAVSLAVKAEWRHR